MGKSRNSQARTRPARIVLLENLRPEPLMDRLGGPIVLFSYAYCSESLCAYDAPHSKVRKGNHPERAKGEGEPIFSHFLTYSKNTISKKRKCGVYSIPFLPLFE